MTAVKFDFSGGSASPGGSIILPQLGLFGDGYTGDLTVPAGTTQKITAVPYYRNLIIPEGSSLWNNTSVQETSVGGCNVIFVKENLIVEGHLCGDGISGGSATSGGSDGAFGRGTADITVGGGGSGGGAGAAGNGRTMSGNVGPGMGGAGGASGAGGSGGAGAGGISRAGGSIVRREIRHVVTNTWWHEPFTTNTPWCVGGGGGGGGGGAGAAGGGANQTGGAVGAGGAGGTFLLVLAKNIIIRNTGKISANGGNGGAGNPVFINIAFGGNRGSGGGGGGGGGGVVFLVYSSLEIEEGGLIEANGGIGGSTIPGMGTGTQGGVGTNGAAGQILRFNISTGEFENG